MSRRAIVVFGLAVAFSSHAVSGGCLEVTSDAVKTSSSTLHVSALVNGKPAPGARIEVFATPDLARPISTFSANARGIVTITHLREGQYLLTGTAPTDLNAQLELIVSPTAPHAPATIAMNLGQNRDAALLHTKLVAAVNSPAKQRVTSLFGTVQDPTGAPVPDTRVRVWKQSAVNGATAADIHAGPEGQFSAALPDGTYTVAFESAGFIPEVVVIEIAKGQPAQSVQVALKVGQC